MAAIPAPLNEPPAVDLNTLVGQFTALRHEINLQTKAARMSLEQTGEALSQLRDTVSELQERPEPEAEPTPLLKAVVDVYDNLALALRQVERQREAIEGPLSEMTCDWLPPDGIALSRLPARRPSFWSFLIAQGTARDAQLVHETVEAVRKEVEVQRQKTTGAANQVRSSLDGLIAGYKMSLARVDRVLDQVGLEPIAAVGEEFDPELMEVVEVAGNTGRPAGEVVEEVRRGYLRGEVVFRYAQVKVAR